MSGKACEIVVGDVLGRELPGGTAVLSDGCGTESGRCNVFVQVRADRQLVRDAKNLGLRMAQVTPSTAVRKCADGVCAEGTRRCWSVLAAGSGRTAARMAERNCGGAVGRKEGSRSRGSSSGFQGDGVTRFECVFDGFDCCSLEWKLHESTFGNGSVEQSPNEQRLASRGARISGHLPNDPGTGTARFIKSWRKWKLAWRLDEFVLSAIRNADDVVLVAASVVVAEVMVAEAIAKLKEVGLSVGAQETHWTSHPRMDGLAVVWDRRCVWMEVQDTRLHADLLKPTNVWRSGDPFFEFIMAPQKAASRPCKNHKCVRLFSGVRACGRW